MNDTMQGENNRTLGFGKIRVRSLEDSNAKGITFKDVAGCDEEKEELQELVEFLKDPKNSQNSVQEFRRVYFLSALPVQVKPYLQKQLQAKQVHRFSLFPVLILLKCMLA